MEKILQKIPFYPFIFASSILILSYNFAIEILQISEFLFLFVIILGSLFLFWILIKKIIKIEKASLIVTVGLAIFFLYGQIYDLVDDFVIGDFYVRHSYLLSLFCIIFVGTSVFIIKSKKPFEKTTFYLNILAIGMILISIGFLFSYTTQIYLGIEEHSTNFPDVYYIVPDSYAHPEILSRVYNYNNSELFSFLNDQGFFVAENSHSNYRHTFLSLASSMNMKYLNYLSEELDNDSRNYHKIYQMVDKNEVMQVFKKNGYKTINFASVDALTGNIESADINMCEKNKFFNSQFLIILVRHSILNPIYKIVNNEYLNERELCLWNELPILHEKINKPIFVFAHLLIPHTPYRFDPNGGHYTYTAETEPEFVVGYLNQVKFSNKIIIDVVEKILKDNPNSIIIVQSDTGTSLYGDIEEEAMKRKMKIINAYYLPEGIQIEYHQSITPVNTFRLLFNELFSSNYELLDDRMYWTPYSREFNFTDVTEILESDMKNE